MKSLICFLVLVVSGYSLKAQTVVKNSLYRNEIAQSRALIDSLRQKQKIPGLDIAVSINGVLVWSEGFGFADLEHKAPVLPGKTRFRIGSVSKPLTAAAVGKLMDNRKLNLDASVYDYVPYFPKKEYPFTVRQLAGHLAGIRHYQEEEFWSTRAYGSVSESLSIFADDSLQCKPGTQFIYSSYGFNLLSAVIEGASREEFLAFMQREIFGPLKMLSSCADKNDSIIVNRTSFYRLDSLDNIHNAPYVDNSYKWAGGGFISTTTDLIKFGEAMTKPGFLSPATLKELTTSQKLQNGESTHYGVGWGVDEDGLLQGYGHTGGSVGGISEFSIYPKEKVIIVILSNSSNVNYGNVAERVVKNFLRKPRN